jgi:hypothetical protein
LALESVHGNRASADRIAAAQSGRALELMNQGLIWLADNLRISYGEGGLLELARMVLRAAAIYPLRIGGQAVPALNPEARLSLIWPRWYAPSAEDRQRDAQTLVALMQAGQMSRETAVRSLSATFDVADVDEELARISEDLKDGR